METYKCVDCGKEVEFDKEYPDNNICKECWDNIKWEED